LKKTVTQAGNATTKEYRGSFEFTGSNLEAYYHEEGILVPKTGGGYQLEYTLKDHLGNARITFADVNVNGSINAANEILQEETYYPFGLQQSGLNTSIAGVENKYQYNGKEFNDDLGINMSDYGARWYMADLGRWGVNDPLAEKYLDMSAYNYVANNPLKYIDPDGMDIYLDQDGNYFGTDGGKSKEVRITTKAAWENASKTEGGVAGKSGTAMLQKGANSTLLVGVSENQPGYQKGIYISNETWGKIEKAGGEKAEAFLFNNNLSSINNFI